MPETNSDFVSVLVPKLHLKQVYGFLATLGDEPAKSPSEEGRPWSPELIRRQFEESQDTIKRLQKILANKPGERFLTSDLASQLKAHKGSKTIAGALGAYGRRVANRYDMTSWPFDATWEHAEGQMSYCMRTDVADIINGL